MLGGGVLAAAQGLQVPLNLCFPSQALKALVKQSYIHTTEPRKMFDES